MVGACGRARGSHGRRHRPPPRQPTVTRAQHRQVHAPRLSSSPSRQAGDQCRSELRVKRRRRITVVGDPATHRQRTHPPGTTAVERHERPGRIEQLQLTARKREDVVVARRQQMVGVSRIDHDPHLVVLITTREIDVLLGIPPVALHAWRESLRLGQRTHPPRARSGTPSETRAPPPAEPRPRWPRLGRTQATLTIRPDPPATRPRPARSRPPRPRLKPMLSTYVTLMVRLGE